MENPFSLSLMGKTMGQTPNNFTIIKLITIIFVYVSRLKKKKTSLIFLCSHTCKLSVSKATILFSFLFSLSGTHLFLFTVLHLLFLLVCVLFSTPHACLLYIEFYRLTLLGTYGVLTFHVSPISS